MDDISKLKSGNLLARGIDAEVAEMYGVKIEYDGSRNEQAYYFPLHSPTNTLVGYQKKRARGPGCRQPTDCSRVGETSGCMPFGGHIHHGGKFVLVTEGAEDALALCQMLKSIGKNYRVVASLGTDAWTKQLEYYNRFEKVAICFDGDKAGRQAAEEFADALPYGKSAIVKLPPDTDPNGLLLEGQAQSVMSAINNAQPYEPSGIITGNEMWRLMENYVEPKYVPYPDEFAQLKEKMEGMREGEISLWTAGTSVGKTSYIRRLKQHALQTRATDGNYWTIGEIELEESAEKTGRGLMQFHAGMRWKYMSQQQRRQAWEETYGTGRIITLGKGRRNRKAKNNLITRFKHLYYDKGCRLFFLDHITLGVREFGDRSGSLADQDEMMEEILDFVESTKSHACLISHLRKPPGGSRTWSQGAIPTEEDMKGCLDASTEYLSPTGWRRMDSYAGGLVGQWKDGSLSFVQPRVYVNKPCDKMLRFHNENSLDMVVSEEHRMLLGGKVRLAADVAKSPGRAEVPVHWQNSLGDPIPDARLMVACAADACYHGNGLAKAEFRKPRKIERFRQLLGDREFTETVDSNGDTTFRFQALTEHKSLDKCAIWYAASTTTLQVLLDEVFRWDGTVAKSGEQVFYTSKEAEADVVQFAAHSCGLTSRIRQYGDRFHVSVARRASPKNRVMLRGDSCAIEEVAPSDGRKYCFAVPSSFFVARHNKRVFVTGNSGSLAQIAFDIIGASRNKQHEDDYERNVSQLHVLKCRETGETGPADRMHWSGDTSRLEPALPPPGSDTGPQEYDPEEPDL